ncbi:unnamed protein product [Cuscuta europaea]|uniref:Transposase (putative) gypsy type domain-containing protein n=1 Tax=Cuscuta europaea TaxID=41803 RepID=A0A9P1E281_CUSEU|nr:unnamed protein product [Cuscuta europaea]
MDDHRHIVLIPNVAVIEQVFSKRALKELQVLLPPPAYYSLRGADNLFMRRPGMVMVHMDSLKAGVRFPLHPFYLDFFEFYGAVPAQFMPNSYRQISAFLVLCKSLGLAFSLELFHYFFQVTPQNADGFLSVAARPTRKLFEGAPSSIHDWKTCYFFICYANDRLPVRWNGYPPKAPTPKLTPVLQEAVDKLRLGGVRRLKGLLTIEALSNARIGTARDPWSLL